MQWFFIALAAPFLWALVNISDKFLVAHWSLGKEKSARALVLFSSLIGIIAATLIGFFTPGIDDIASQDKLLLIFIGAFSVIWILLYILTLEIEEVSAVIPWMLSIPVFGYILGYFFLGETLTHRELWGGAIIFLGAIILSVDFSKIKLMFKGRVALYMLASCLIYSINGVIFKFIASAESFWVASFWEYLGLGLGGIILFLFFRSYRRDFIDMLKTGGTTILSVNIGSETITIAGNLLTNYALLIAPVSLVFMVGSFQPVAVLLLTFLSTKFAPKVVKEDFSKEVIVPKLIAILVMLIGSAILFL